MVAPPTGGYRNAEQVVERGGDEVDPDASDRLLRQLHRRDDVEEVVLPTRRHHRCEDEEGHDEGRERGCSRRVSSRWLRLHSAGGVTLTVTGGYYEQT